MKAEFREISSDEFKERYLFPFDNALKNRILNVDYYWKIMIIHLEMLAIWKVISSSTAIEK